MKITENIITKYVNGYTNNTITDEEMTEFIKEIYTNGISDQLLFFLTKEMMNSGEVLQTPIDNLCDKHSTGGVSDTTTLIVAPICACLNTKMLKLSGRGLGHTGGTCDKLECFENYQTDIDINEAFELVQKNGACILTSSKNIAPADKKIYALRNKTNYIDSIPLIASSIMSKKLASGAHILVLDVKYGNGAFMQTKRLAKILAKKMQKIGESFGRVVKINLGKMDQPLGNNIGPMLETQEAISVLKNECNNQLYKESVRIAALCVSASNKIKFSKAKKQVENVLKNGDALKKFKTMVKAQGGKTTLFTKKIAKPTFQIIAQENIKIKHINTKHLGEIVAQMGTVKTNETDQIQYQNGIITHFNLNQKIKKGQLLFSVFYKKTEFLEQQLLNCINK